MPKYCYVFTFVLVYVLWYLVNEVKCSNNDLEFRKPDRKFETKSDSDESDDGIADETCVVDDVTKKCLATKHESRRSRAKVKKKNAWLHFRKERKEENMKQRKGHSRHKRPPKVLQNKKSGVKEVTSQNYSNASDLPEGTANTEKVEFIKPRLNLRHRFGKRWMGSAKMLRSTRMPPNHELQQLVDDESQEQSQEMGNLSPYSIAEQLRHLDAIFPDVDITHEIIGRTIEYNDIVLLKVSRNNSEIIKKFPIVYNYLEADESKFVNELKAKKIIFIVHGLSVMGFNGVGYFTSEYMFLSLVSYYFKFLYSYDIFLIPMANPDGVALKRSLWNKNNSPQIHCNGVSLDRNFDVAWNGTRGISSCDQQYPGPKPFSELETQAIREVFHRYSQNIIAYIHVHAGTYNKRILKGDAVLYPKGYTDMQTDDDKYKDLKGEIDEEMKNAGFRSASVAVETLYNWYGPVAGTSVDYASTIYGIPFAMEAVFQEHSYDDSYEKHIIKSLALTEIWQRVFRVIFKHIWMNAGAVE